jgi:hypothetical protein
MKTLIALILVAVVLKVTNPKIEDHRSEINKIINSEMAYKRGDSKDSLEGVFSFFGESLVRGIANEMITMNDYHLFSTTILEYQGVRHVVGFAILGNVLIFNEAEQDIRGLIRENL